MNEVVLCKEAGSCIRHIDSEPEVAACHPVMRQLRPHLLSEQEFITRWRRQITAGYKLAAVWLGQKPVALAGYRLQESLFYGRHLYVDDLVADQTVRSHGYGHAMMDYLKREGKNLGCSWLVLDTGLTNALAQRFYHRENLSMTALRFSAPLA
jgi:ribosomal protein S18 acetylase RimI-like enzyme